MNRSGVQHALFGTLPGRAIVIGVAIRLGVYAVGAALGNVPLFLSVVDTVASIGLAIGAAYFAYKLILLGKRRLLWRVRRKLILSYVFVGFIPAALIVSFFLLSGFLLFYNFSSYLVQSRLNAIALPACREHIRLRTPELGTDAALIGAAELAFEHLLEDPLFE